MQSLLQWVLLSKQKDFLREKIEEMHKARWDPDSCKIRRQRGELGFEGAVLECMREKFGADKMVHLLPSDVTNAKASFWKCECAAGIVRGVGWHGGLPA